MVLVAAPTRKVLLAHPAGELTWLLDLHVLPLIRQASFCVPRQLLFSPIWPLALVTNPFLATNEGYLRSQLCHPSRGKAFLGLCQLIIYHLLIRTLLVIRGLRGTSLPFKLLYRAKISVLVLLFIPLRVSSSSTVRARALVYYCSMSSSSFSYDMILSSRSWNRTFFYMTLLSFIKVGGASYSTQKPLTNSF